MSASITTDKESARRREDVLRELNLYPLWQLRAPVSLNPDNVIDVGRALARHPKGEEASRMHVGLKPDLQSPDLQSPDFQAPDFQASNFQAPDLQSTEQQVAQAEVGEQARSDIGLLNWAELKKRVKACTACKLRAGCMQTVFGTGDEKADWLFVGSWPTEDDESSGEPFAGQAGQLLDNMLTAIKLKRGVNVYLANVVKCSGSIKSGPGTEEIAMFSPYLARQIELLQPKIIVALGHAAATALLGEDREWGSLLGKVHEFRGFKKENPCQAIPLIITHHPAALLLTSQNKAQTWRDLCLARDTMRNL